MNIKGYCFSAVEAGIKKPGRYDLALIFSEIPAQVAAVYTSNRVKAAPVILSMTRTMSGLVQAVVVNSGNANACTGEQGMVDAMETSSLVAEGLGIAEDAVLVSSTGVIGQPLPMERFHKAIPRLIEGLDAGTLDDVARAIMTTDTVPKIEWRFGTAGGLSYSLAGIAKGAGMIMPQMATMLAFIVTDACIEPSFLKQAFHDAVATSFNMISVDGDMSTNDTAFILANGAAGNSPIKAGTDNGAEFAQLLRELLLSLAKKIVYDGEGATKFVAITVCGAATVADAKKTAMTVANSLLVKTAFFGEDANWGRILAAVGYSGVDIDPDRISIDFGAVPMVRNGVFAGGDAEARGTEVLSQDEITVTINLQLGSESATVYTSDLSYDYVRINADYRT